MYLVPLGDIARSHGVTFHAYANDCQLYIAFSREKVSMTKYKMETLLAEIKQWMSTNMLKLNDSKTEIMAVGGPRRNLTEVQSLTVGNEEVDVTKCVRLLGVDFDSHLTLKQHLRNTAKNCFYTLKNMFKIRRCINETAAKAIVYTMITSKLDYCNTILYGLSESTLKHFTRVQNLSARFISQHGKHEHITPVLKQFQWLPIRQRIHYKVLILIFKSLNGLAPAYLEELIKRRPMKRTRADGNNDLVIPVIKHKSFVGRSLGYGGPKLWNTLPKELKTCTNINTFKKLLKTFLFKEAYLQ